MREVFARWLERNHVALLTLVVFGLSCALLAAGAWLFVDLDHIYVRGLGGILNDQAGYINVARGLFENGRLESTAIYPSTLNQPTTKNYFYLPGHYWALASSFALFGFGVLPSLLPALISYVLTTSLLFLLTARLYSPKVALLAAAMFALFPANFLLAFTAMSELTLTMASVAVLYVFVSLPHRVRWMGGPILTLVPLTVRETGAFVAGIMLFVLLFEDGQPWRTRIRRASQHAVLSAALVFAFMTSHLSTGRPALQVNNLIGESQRLIYTDAFAVEGVDTSLANITTLVKAKFNRNLRALVGVERGHYRAAPGERIMLFWMLLPIPAGMWLASRRRDGFALGVAVATGVILLLLLLLYTVWGFRGVRNLMLMQPFGAAVLSQAGVVLLERRPRVYAPCASAIAAALLLFSFQFMERVYAPQRFLRELGKADLGFLDRIRHDPRTVLVAPYQLTPEYVLERFPVRCSFIPANEATLRLLESKWRVGTIVYPLLGRELRLHNGMLSPLELQRNGWAPVADVTHKGVRFLILRKAGGET